MREPPMTRVLSCSGAAKIAVTGSARQRPVDRQPLPPQTAKAARCGWECRSLRDRSTESEPTIKGPLSPLDDGRRNARHGLSHNRTIAPRRGALRSRGGGLAPGLPDLTRYFHKTVDGKGGGRWGIASAWPGVCWERIKRGPGGRMRNGLLPARWTPNHPSAMQPHAGEPPTAVCAANVAKAISYQSGNN